MQRDCPGLLQAIHSTFPLLSLKFFQVSRCRFFTNWIVDRRPISLRPSLILVLGLSIVSLAHAQSVRWETGDSGDPSELQLIFEDCAPEGDPQLPRIDGTTLTLVG